MRKIRVFEAFAGYGSQAIALKRLQRDFPNEVEFEFVGISDAISAGIDAALELITNKTKENNE